MRKELIDKMYRKSSVENLTEQDLAQMTTDEKKELARRIATDCGIDLKRDYGIEWGDS